MVSKSGLKFGFCVVLAIAATLGTAPVVAQEGGGGGGGPDPGGGPTTGGPAQTQPPRQGTTGGGGFGGGGAIDPTGQATEINPSVSQLITSTDTRNQGFVGSTSDRVREFGFVGAASLTSGPPLAQGASFGGGNNARGAAGAGGLNRAGGLNNRMGAGFSPFGAQNGVEIFRSGLRTTWSMNFDTPTVQPEQLVANFNNSFRNLPVSQGSQLGHVIEMVGTTAIVTGAVASQEEANRLINQLRLQPGIYQIDNQLEVRQ